MKKTHIKAELLITSFNVSPTLLTEKLGIEPTQAWAKGDDVIGKDLKRKDSLWLLSTVYQESLDVNESIALLMDILKPEKNALQEIKRLYDVKYTLEIMIKIRDEEAPAIYFNTNCIQFINDIGAEIDIDLYV